jgi:uncharacterized OB-fold protein
MKTEYGWVCPKCQTVYAPHIESCKYCSKNVPVTFPNIPPYKWSDPFSPPYVVTCVSIPNPFKLEKPLKQVISCKIEGNPIDTLTNTTILIS